MNLSDKLKKAAVILNEKANEDFDFAQLVSSKTLKAEIEAKCVETKMLAHDLNEIAKRMSAL